MLNHQAGRKQDVSAGKSSHVTEVFCDFDGTITLVDATDAVLETFALPAWREWEQRWVQGEITSQECLSRQVGLIRADRETLIEFVAELSIDEGIFELARRCAEERVPLTIVSDGIDLIVEAVLRRHGLLHLPVFSNHLRWDEKGLPVLSFPFSSQGCESGAGTCKCSLARASDPSRARPVYIGDGQSDQCVAAKIQTVFAKGTLRKWCDRQAIAHEPFETLSEVADHLFPRKARVV